MIANALRQGKADGTLRMYREKLRHIQRIFGEKTPLARIDAPSIDAFIATREAEGASTHTVHKELVALRQLLKVARRRGEYGRDPGAVMPVGYAARYVPRKRFLTHYEAFALLAVLSPARRRHVAFILATGARFSEAAAARFEDAWGRTVYLRGTKTEGARRQIPIPPGVFGAYELAIPPVPPKNGMLFQPWPNMRRDLHVACKAAGIQPVSANDLRRTFGSWLRQAGTNTADIGVLMGHASSAMVEKVYGKTTPESLAAALGRTESAQQNSSQRENKLEPPETTGLRIRRSSVRIRSGAPLNPTDSHNLADSDESVESGDFAPVRYSFDTARLALAYAAHAVGVLS